MVVCIILNFSIVTFNPCAGEPVVSDHAHDALGYVYSVRWVAGSRKRNWFLC
ncbi:MAG: hypothetical protein N2512_15285 [Armatimonadetes bacterium]|nr:hypothetical protein [Armatimonadota bacterium]